MLVSSLSVVFHSPVFFNFLYNPSSTLTTRWSLPYFPSFPFSSLLHGLVSNSVYSLGTNWGWLPPTGFWWNVFTARGPTRSREGSAITKAMEWFMRPMFPIFWPMFLGLRSSSDSLQQSLSVLTPESWLIRMQTLVLMTAQFALKSYARGRCLSLAWGRDYLALPLWAGIIIIKSII